MNKPKGSRLALIPTKGINPGDYDLYNLVGLTAGKVQCIIDALAKHDTVLSKEILAVIPQIKLF